MKWIKILKSIKKINFFSQMLIFHCLKKNLSKQIRCFFYFPSHELSELPAHHAILRFFYSSVLFLKFLITDPISEFNNKIRFQTYPYINIAKFFDFQYANFFILLIIFIIDQWRSKFRTTDISEFRNIEY